MSVGLMRGALALKVLCLGVSFVIAPVAAQEIQPQPLPEAEDPADPGQPVVPQLPEGEVERPSAPPKLDLVPVPEENRNSRLTAGERRNLASGPASVADLAERLLPAVVNISTTAAASTEGEGEIAPPDLPDDSPFKEYFDDFFENRSDDTPQAQPNSLGSGFVIDAANRYVVTNNHVIEGGGEITAIFPDGTRIGAVLRGTDEKTDLAVLQLEETDDALSDVKFGPSGEMRIGDWVMAIGNPFGLGGTVTVGIVSAINRDIEAGPYDDFIQTDAAINRGNSGGPLFNMYGEVIGINTAIISPSGGSIGIGFSVPSDLARGVVDQLIRFGETRRGWLGVRIEPVTPEIAESLDLDRTQGALVAAIIEPGPVDDGQIEPGDIIVSFDGRTVAQSRDLPRIVADTAVGREVEIVVIRDGREQTVSVTLGRLEDADQEAEDVDESAPTEEGGALDDQNDEENPGASLSGVVLADLDDTARARYQINEELTGVVIASVEPGSDAGQRQLEAGTVILAIGQQVVSTVEEAEQRLNALKEAGRRNAFLLLARPDGETFIETLPID